MPEFTVTTTIEARGPAAAIVVTADQVASLGAGKTPAVSVRVGTETVRTRVGYRGGEALIGLSRERREALGVSAGDVVEATIALDTAPREVQIPDDLFVALAKHPGAREAYDALSPSRRTELARQVAEAKRDDTRERRIAAVLDALNS